MLPRNYPHLFWDLCERAREFYGEIRVRPHPLVETPHKSLEDELAEARLAITWSSTSAVEAVLAGVPVVCMDKRCAAWPVASHDVSMIIRPERLEWLSELTWRNWTHEELASGEAWEFLREYAIADRDDHGRGRYLAS